VITATDQLAGTLKRWTEQVLRAVAQQELGEQFLFGSVDPATASPTEMFLTPVWQQAFGDSKTPLLMLE
jgi:hypothetical protein